MSQLRTLETPTIRPSFGRRLRRAMEGVATLILISATAAACIGLAVRVYHFAAGSC